MTYRTCQWIEGEPSADDACKCGLPVELGRPYCRDHLRRSRGTVMDAVMTPAWFAYPFGANRSVVLE